MLDAPFYILDVPFYMPKDMHETGSSEADVKRFMIGFKAIRIPCKYPS